MVLLDSQQKNRQRGTMRWTKHTLLIGLCLVTVIAMYRLSTCGAGDHTSLGRVNVLTGSHSLVRDGSKQTVVLTGGLGFIGSHVAEELLARNFQVIVYDDESNGHNYNANTFNMHADVTVVNDFAQIERLGLRVDYLIHLAAAISVAESMKMPEKYARTNVEGSKKVFLWALAHGVRHVVAASSAAIYGNPAEDKMPIREEIGYGGVSPYADSKFKMEKVMESMNKEYGLCATALRFFNVYGPRQDPKSAYSGVISIFMDRAKAGTTVGVLGDGKQTRDFVYVKDVAHAIITAMLLDSCKFDVFNVCTGKEITVQKLAETVVELFGTGSKIKNLPPRDGDVKKSVCNPDHAKQGLGFTYRYDVHEGMKHTRDWFNGDGPRLQQEANAKAAKLRGATRA